MKKLILALLAIISVTLPGLAADKLVFYKNADSWSNPNIWTWNSNSEGAQTNLNGYYDSYSYAIVSTNMMKFRDGNWTHQSTGDISLSSYPKALCWAGTSTTASDVKIILNGNFTGSWKETEMAYNPADMTFTAEIDVTNGSGKYMMKFKADSDTKYHYGGSSTTLTTGNSVSQTASDNGNYSLSTGKYKFTYSVKDNKKLSVTKVASEIVKYQLRGSTFSSEGGWGDIDMTLNGSVWIAKNVTLKNGTTFGIKGLNTSGGQEQWIWGNKSAYTFASSSTLTAIIQDTNGSNGSNWQYTGSDAKYDFSYNPAENKLTVTSPVGTDLKFKSNISGSWNDGVAMTAGENNIWTYNAKVTKTGTEFVIKASGNEYHPSVATTVELGKEYKLATGTTGTNFKFPAAGDYIVTVNAADISNMTVTVTEFSYPDLDLYIGGNKVGQTVSSTDGKYVWNFGKIEAGSTVQLRNAANADDHYAYDGSVSLNRWVYLSNKKGVSTSIPRTLLDGTITANLANNTFKIAGTRDVKPMPEGKFVYFNTGADYYTTMGENPIYAAFIKKDGSSTTPEQMNDIREYDKNAMLPIFFAKIPDDYENYKGVEFSVKNNSGNTIIKYNSTKYSGSSSAGSKNSDYDSANWWKYIYGCGLATTEANVSAADQSFITYEDYIKVRDGRKTAVYFAGNNIEFQNADGSYSAIDWNGNLGESDKNDDVYFANFRIKDKASDDTKFKMTWINVNKRLDDSNAANGQSVGKGSQRWWATFNVGIVGPTLPPGTTSIANAPADVVKKGENGGNHAVAFIIPRCREYSRLNQWDWWISKAQIDDHSSAEFCIILDTDYKTAALLDFKPQPTMTVDALNGTETNVLDINDETLQQTFGGNLLGSATAGTAKIDKVNDVSGKATMQVSNMNFLADSYELSYLIYSDDKLIAEFEGVPGAHHYDIKLNHMVYGANMPISCRAFYHDLKNDTHFRSLYEEKKFTATQKQLIQPTVSDNAVKKQVIFKDNDGWHAQVDVEFVIEPVEVPMTVDGTETNVPLSVYPDFSIIENSQGTEINLARQDDFQVQNGMADAHDPNNAKGDWAKAAILNETDHSYRLRLVFRNIEKADADWDAVQGKTYDLEANIIAQYPFYIDYDNDCEVTAYDASNNKIDVPAPAGVRRKASGIAEDRATGQTVVMSPMKTPAKTTVSSADLSGIIDAGMFGGDGEVELYNLQGIRVVGDPAPGIYLRRCGDKVTKVIVK